MTLSDTTLQLVDDSDTVLFDFNDGTNTQLLYNTGIPYPSLTEAGHRKKFRAVSLADHDRNKIEIPVGFHAKGASKLALATIQDALFAELERKRGILKFNPDPTALPAVYFDTYRCIDQPAFDLLWHTANRQEHQLLIPADPFARLAPVTIFNQTTVLAEMDGETAEWDSGFESGSTFVWGTKSRDRTEFNWMTRNIASPLNLSAYTTTGWINLWRAFVNGTFGYVWTLKLRIGSDSSNYREWVVNETISHSWQKDWRSLLIDYNAPTSTTGNPNHASIAYLSVYHSNTDPAATTMRVDNITISNGKVKAPRARAPFYCTLYGVETNAPAPLLLRTKQTVGVNRVSITRKEDTVSELNTIVGTPENPAPTGWDNYDTIVGTSTVHQGQYAEYTMDTTGKKIHPFQAFMDLCRGKYSAYVRLANYDAGTTIVKWAGQDKNNPDWAYGPEKKVTALGNIWQYIYLGELSLPFFGFPGAADEAQMYSYFGLFVQASAGTPILKVDYVELKPVDGGGRIIIPPATLQYLSLDTRAIGSQGVFGSSDGTDNNSFGLGHRSRGDLKALGPGDNIISLHARDTNTPTLVPEFEIIEAAYIPRYPVGKA